MHRARLAERSDRLDELLEQLAPVLVAFSGGVDSSLLLARARRLLGSRAAAVIGVSPSLARSELEQARRIARDLEAPLIEVPTRELERPGYVANAGDRCYHCKSELYLRLEAVPGHAGWTICDGTHAGDRLDDRPGHRAARERGVRSPLREAGLDKDDIRALARQLGLANWDRPARPCLASRVVVGQPVSPALLADVEALEAVLAAEGFRIYRARVDGERVIVELGADELHRLGEEGWRRRLLAVARQRGHSRVLVDLAGYGAPVARPRPAGTTAAGTTAAGTTEGSPGAGA